jgi:hypothetical protein
MPDKAPAPMVKLTGGNLSPVTAWDAELLAGFPDGQMFDAAPRSKRSLPHHRMYWAQLGQIVKATEAFATPDHMHDWVKVKLGYIRPILGPKGQIVGMTVDSTAFAAMDQRAFGVFYEKFSKLAAEEMGIDVGAMV